MTSVLNVDSIAAKDGTSPVALTKQQAPKMWTTVNQSTAAIKDSLNTASITDHSTGLFTHTATSAMSNANYAVSGTNIGDTQSSYALNVCGAGVANTTTAHKYYNYNTVTDGHNDAVTISTVVQGDLA